MVWIFLRCYRFGLSESIARVCARARVCVMFDATEKEKDRGRRRGEKKANYVPNMWYSVSRMAFDAF